PVLGAGLGIALDQAVRVLHEPHPLLRDGRPVPRRGLRRGGERGEPLGQPADIALAPGAAGPHALRRGAVRFDVQCGPPRGVAEIATDRASARNWPGGQPTSRLNTTLKYSGCSNPTSSAIRWIGCSLSPSSCLARPIWTERISACGERPRYLR